MTHIERDPSAPDHLDRIAELLREFDRMRAAGADAEDRKAAPA
jgi:hypothetical protein